MNKKDESVAFLKLIVEQALGCGLFKRVEDIMNARDALEYLHANAIDINQLIEERREAGLSLQAQRVLNEKMIIKLEGLGVKMED